jgi:hypothetical protein
MSSNFKQQPTRAFLSSYLHFSTTCVQIVWYNGEVLCARGSWEVGSAKALELLLDNLKKTPLMESSAPLYISNSAGNSGFIIQLVFITLC